MSIICLLTNSQLGREMNYTQKSSLVCLDLGKETVVTETWAPECCCYIKFPYLFFIHFVSAQNFGNTGVICPCLSC